MTAPKSAEAWADECLDPVPVNDWHRSCFEQAMAQAREEGKREAWDEGFEAGSNFDPVDWNPYDREPK